MKTHTNKENYKSVKAEGHEKELHIPAMEHLKSIPEFFGIRVNEEPAYEVLKSDGPFEVRRYQTQVLAETTINGTDFNAFRETAFKKLAGYIFGENKSKEKMADKTADQPETMAMTSPVLQQEGLEHEWTMSFVLPHKYTLHTAPTPVSDEIKLRSVPGYVAATVRYSGVNSPEDVKEHEAQLIKWINAQPELRLEGTFFAAQYDAPFAVPFLRRNEVMIKVEMLQS